MCRAQGESARFGEARRVAQSKIQYHQPPGMARDDPDSRQEVLYNQDFLRK